MLIFSIFLNAAMCFLGNYLENKRIVKSGAIFYDMGLCVGIVIGYGLAVQLK